MNTLQDIADELGVAVSTVSRALAGKPGVSEARRKQIAELADQRGIRPDLNASALRSGKRHGLELIIPAIDTDVSRLRHDALLSQAQQEYGHVNVHAAMGDVSCDTLIRQAISRKPEALIISRNHGPLSPQTVDLLRSHQIPACTLDSTIPGLDSVIIDRSIGAYQAARLLFLSDCKHPVFTISPSDTGGRLEGVTRAVKDMTSYDDASPFIVNPSGYLQAADGERLMREILQRRAVDGIFYYNDYMAIGGMRALHKQGIRVPEDIKVIGFDDLSLAEHLPVNLTTVAQPIEEPVQDVLTLLRERRTEFNAPVQTKSHNTKLIIRESAPVLEHGHRQLIFNQ